MSNYTKSKSYTKDDTITYADPCGAKNLPVPPEQTKKLDDVSTYLQENNVFYQTMVSRLVSVATRLDPYGDSASDSASDGDSDKSKPVANYPIEIIFNRLEYSRDLNFALAELVDRLERI